MAFVRLSQNPGAGAQVRSNGKATRGSRTFTRQDHHRTDSLSAEDARASVGLYALAPKRKERWERRWKIEANSRMTRASISRPRKGGSTSAEIAYLFGISPAKSLGLPLAAR